MKNDIAFPAVMAFIGAFSMGPITHIYTARCVIPRCEEIVLENKEMPNREIEKEIVAKGYCADQCYRRNLIGLVDRHQLSPAEAHLYAQRKCESEEK